MKTIFCTIWLQLEACQGQTSSFVTNSTKYKGQQCSGFSLFSHYSCGTFIVWFTFIILLSPIPAVMAFVYRQDIELFTQGFMVVSTSLSFCSNSGIPPTLLEYLWKSLLSRTSCSNSGSPVATASWTTGKNIKQNSILSIQ
jgi:hypothetical protein